MNIVILAAGVGKRMRSTLPKVLHPLGGKPLILHVIQVARSMKPSRIVVVIGHNSIAVQEAVDAPDVKFACQSQQLGTGHALRQALPLLDSKKQTLVLYGDVPLMRTSTLERLTKASFGEKSYGILTVLLDEPNGYGRIVRNSAGSIESIIEHRDASTKEQKISEVNTGIVVIPTAQLEIWLNVLKNKNAQGEFHLTDVVNLAINAGFNIIAVQPENKWETFGVNCKAQLAKLERIYQANLASNLLANGVTLADPTRIDIRGTLICGRDVSIDINCLFEGDVTLEDNVSIGPNCIIRHSLISSSSRINAFSHIDGSKLGIRTIIGPYARLREGTQISDEAHIGNFVEVKNVVIGHGSKAKHLAYLGDADVGAQVNIGAGTITCNYDGVNKFRTIIEDNVFVGSDTQLIAPVRIGCGATIAAGTTIWKDVDDGLLTFNDKKQSVKSDYVRGQIKKKL
ncbi:MAG: bifunctional UDP-N-acetylglucosamine diphosphorylase/glucosamine-1-phosphate N-acetyltransferase GlmU [Burkholderia sp.]|nr:bifunctional UDP-N-acetylglucosamine diphosphorylase/glucosamine-1-phosphate N-acetyltransferase GlmU [Burkholderia sp.]